MENQIVYQGKIKFKEMKSNWKCRWAILEESDNTHNEDPNARSSNYTLLRIRKSKEGEVRHSIPLYFLCCVDKHIIDKKNYAIILVIASKFDTGDTYLVQGDTIEETDVWFDHFSAIVGAGMSKFPIKLPKIIKWKYNGPGVLYFYEEQRFITITDDNKIPKYVGTWPIQLLRRYGGDDPNKFIFESGRRCFGGVNYYHVASPQAYDIKALCNKVSSSRINATSSSSNLPSSTALQGYNSGEDLRNRQTSRTIRPMMGNNSGGSVISKRSSGSCGSDMGRQLSNRPSSEAMESGASFRSSNNSILSNRSSGRESYCSDTLCHEEDSGIDTLDSKGITDKDTEAHDMYMVMNPVPAMPAIAERRTSQGTDDVYECMRSEEGEDSYISLRNWQEVQIGNSNYMTHVPTQSPTHPPSTLTMASSGTMGKPKKLINYPPLPSPQHQVSPTSSNYMNMADISLPSPVSPTTSSIGGSADQSCYVNIDTLNRSRGGNAPSRDNGCYMNIDKLSRNYQGLNVQQQQPNNVHHQQKQPQLYTNLASVNNGVSNGGASNGNYMNISLLPNPTDRRRSTEHPIYDTPTQHIRSYANVDNKLVALSVSNPIYGNQQKVKT